MYGILCYDAAMSRWRTKTERLTLLGRPFLHITVKGKGQLRRAERRFRRQGVRTVVPPQGGGDSSFGLEWVDVAPFLQAQAALLVEAGLQRLGRRPEESVVALRGRCATAWLRRAAETLCPKVKGLVLNVKEGGDVLAEDLYLNQGMGVLQERPGLVPDVAVCFSQEKTGGEAGLTYSLCRERIDLCGASFSLKEDVEKGAWGGLPLLAALWEAGAVRPEMLTVEWA